MRNKKGFTLIELLIVMAILIILGLIAFPQFLDYTQKEQTIKNDKQLEQTIDVKEFEKPEDKL
jgi:prepilin-type N-terminal cleavage/methylation domain-containing protein